MEPIFPCLDTPLLFPFRRKQSTLTKGWTIKFWTISMNFWGREYGQKTEPNDNKLPFRGL